jgi:PKD repeat protein
MRDIRPIIALLAIIGLTTAGFLINASIQRTRSQPITYAGTSPPLIHFEGPVAFRAVPRPPKRRPPMPNDYIASAEIASETFVIDTLVTVALNAAAVAKLEYCRANNKTFYLGIKGNYEPQDGFEHCMAFGSPQNLVTNIGSIPHANYANPGDAGFATFQSNSTCLLGSERLYVGGRSDHIARGLLKFEAPPGTTPITSASIQVTRLAKAGYGYDGYTLHFVVLESDVPETDINGTYSSLATTNEYVSNAAPTVTITAVRKTGRVVEIDIEAADTDGTIASGSYDWDDIDPIAFTAGDLVTLNAAGTLTKTHTYSPAGGSFTITASVTDDGDATGTDTEAIVVSANSAPSCSLALNSNAYGTVSVTPTAADSDGTISSLIITWGDGQTTTGCTSGQAYQHTYATGGQKTIYATAVDNESGSTQSTSLTPTVALNVAPTCSLAVDGIVRRTVTVTVQGQDSDGSLTAGIITWQQGVTTTLTAGERATLQAGGTVTKSHGYAAGGGTFGIFASLTDNAGATTDSSIAQAVVSPNLGPTASFTTEVDADDNLAVTINANGSSDPDGSIVSWRCQVYEGAEWISRPAGTALVHGYPEHGTYLITVEVTDNEGGTDEASAYVDATNEAPTAAGEATVVFRTVTIEDQSTDSDGTIASGTVDWSDGSEPEAITPGGTLEHVYPNTTADYNIILTAVDDDGDEDSALIPVEITAWAPTFDITSDGGAQAVLVTTANMTPPDGETITAYSWDWGDGTPDGTGDSTTHTYADGGIHTITLTVTLSDGNDYTTQKETTMSAIITKVATATGPLAQPAVTVIVITGTSLPLTGEVKIGGKVATVEVSPARSATAISVKAASDTPLGAQDVEVYNAETPAVLQATAKMAIMMYDPTDERDGLEVPFLAVDYIWIDGLNVGFAGDGFSLTPTFTNKEYTPPNRFTAANSKSWLSSMDVDLKIDQVDGPNLAIVLGGTWDAATSTLTVSATDEMARHSIVAKDIYGNLTLIRAALIVGGGKLTFSKDFGSVETTWRALQLAGVPMLEKYGFDSGS